MVNILEVWLWLVATPDNDCAMQRSRQGYHRLTTHTTYYCMPVYSVVVHLLLVLLYVANIVIMALQFQHRMSWLHYNLVTHY